MVWMDLLFNHLIIHPLKDIWALSGFVSIVNNTSLNIHDMFLCRHNSISLDECSELQLLGHMVVACLVFGVTDKQFSRLAAPFSTPTSTVWETLFLFASIGWLWRRSLRGHDPWASPRHSEAPYPPLSLECPSVHCSMVGAVFKDAAWREQWAAETLWTIYIYHWPPSGPVQEILRSGGQV